MANLTLDWKWFGWGFGCNWAEHMLPQITNAGLTEDDLKRSVYILRLNGPFAIEYPKGNTSVLYIGEGNFKSRLNTHVKEWLCDLEEIVQHFGLTIGVTTPRVRGNAVVYKDVEAILLQSFGELYGTAPLNNKQFEFSKITHTYNQKDIDSVLKIGRGIKHKWSIKPMKANKFYDVYHRTHRE